MRFDMFQFVHLAARLKKRLRLRCYTECKKLLQKGSDQDKHCKLTSLSGDV